MIAARALAVVIGLVLTLSVLVSALETVVLPRHGFTRIARLVFAVGHRLLIHRWRSPVRETRIRGLYGPMCLATLPLVWMLSVAVGFTFIFWGIAAGDLPKSFELSGSSLTTLGFSKPVGSGRIWLTFTEAIIGLGLIALLIGFLPTIYTSHSDREKGIAVLRPFAGTPPSAVTLVATLHRSGSLDNPEVWRTAAEWMLNLDQSHGAFPALCYFPDSSDEQSWVASAGALMDAAALLLSVGPHLLDEDATGEVKGAMLAMAYGVPTLGRVARSVGLPVPPPLRPAELIGRSGAPPAISVSRAEYEGALADLSEVLTVPAGDVDRCWTRFAWLRSGYDRAVAGLAGLTQAAPARWTTDRPARVGRPRLLSGGSLEAEWSVAAPAEVS